MNVQTPLLAQVSVRPVPTMQSILERPERPPAIPVVVAAIVSWSLRDLRWELAEQAISALGVAASILVALAVILATVLVSILFYFVVSAAAAAAGRWMLGGRGTYRDVRQAIAWGLAPQVWAIFFRLPAVFLWPEALAILRGGNREIRIGDLSITPFLGEVPLYQLVLVFLVELGFLIWYLVVGSHTLSVAQGFSPMRGFANLLLAVILPFVALVVLAVALALTIWTAN